MATLTKAQHDLITRLQEEGTLARLAKYRGYSCILKNSKWHGWANSGTLENLIKRGVLTLVREDSEGKVYQLASRRRRQKRKRGTDAATSRSNVQAQAVVAFSGRIAATAIAPVAVIMPAFVTRCRFSSELRQGCHWRMYGTVKTDTGAYCMAGSVG
jgi:hypothetical protein